MAKLQTMTDPKPGAVLHVTMDAEDFEMQKVRTEPETGDVIFQAVAVDSKPRPNRNGFAFAWKKPEDIGLEAYQANPCLFWQHDASSFPVGQTEEMRVNRKALAITGRLPDHSKNAALAEQDRTYFAPIREMVKLGKIRAVSIGFIPTEWERKETEDGNDYIECRKFDLCEISLVGIPAHETALIAQAAPTLETMTPAPIQHDAPIWTTAMDGETIVRHMAHAVAANAEREVVAAPAPAAVPNPTPAFQAREGFQAIPYSRHGDCPTADEGEKWSGPSAMKADPEELALICTFENADRADVKAGYKMPHHHPGGKKPTVVWNGVRSAMGALLGARGGVKGVSPEEKKKGYHHLSEHYAQFDKEPPELQSCTPEQIQQLAR
jgi:HK97 family phage prohead protease